MEFEDGVATVKGRCASAEQRETAIFVVGNVVGVHRVVDATEALSGGDEACDATG